jgi:metal-responsive CopG/Arc/MetJ family transcriptional regulator
MRYRMTVSVPADLLAAAERAGKRYGLPTRSAIVADALELLVKKAQADEVDASLDAYYASRSEDERTEESAMVRAFRRSRRRLDLDRDR